MTDDKKPVLTIITPSYNQGHFLQETIESVLNQDVPGLEYIIVDGGSSDNSVEVIKKYEKHLKWWVSEKDRGQSHAINKGLEHATGQFVAYLNSDDVYLPGALHSALDLFAKTPGARWIAGGTIGFGTAAAHVDEWHLPTVPTTQLDCLTMRFQIAQPANIWSTEMLKSVGGFDESFRYLFDNNLYAVLLARGEICHPIERPLAGYRFHATSKTVSEGSLFEAEWDRIRDEFLPKLVYHQRVIARHRLAMLRSGADYTRAAKAGEAGRVAEARALFWRGVAAYPPSILSRSGLGCARRMFF